jgi:3-hydroxyacyl-CoA dehydrogenase
LLHFARHGNVALLTLDHPPVNAISLALQKELSLALDRAAQNPEIRAIIIAGSPRIFSGGGDIHELQKVVAGALASEMEFMRTLVLRIEDTPIPVVAALSGQVLGGGLELALACHFRIAVPSARLGLPEVKLGIIPGAGGALRLPRLVGPSKAIEICAQGKLITAAEALEQGLVDKIIEGDLLEGAIAFAGEVAGRPFRKTRDHTEKLGSPEENAPIFTTARESLQRQQSHFPAPLLAVDVIEAATLMSFEEAWQFESNASSQSMATPQARALIHLFLAEREVSRIPDVPKGTPTLPIRSAGILGAGTMGGGIAMVFANAGIPVSLKDADQAALDRGINAIRKNYESSVRKGRISSQVMEERLALIRPTQGWGGFDQADIVVEAIFENLAAKQEAFAELDKVCKSDAIFASNSSTLDIDRIAAATSRPAAVIGTHFFIPPPVMRIVEIVRGLGTGKDVIATTMQLAARLGKTGVLVGNCRGFVANRIAERYRIQAGFLVEEGAGVETVDQALVEFGMTIGPLAVGDIAGLDIIWAGRTGVREAEMESGVRQPIEDRLCDLKRFGRKSGVGWYKYDNDRRARPDPELPALIRQWAAAAGIMQRHVSDEEIVERCIYMLVNEGARILDEGIALRASDIDVIFVKAYGFPAWRGGPMWYADTVGPQKIYKRICDFYQQHGSVWAPAPLLRRLAESGGSFYGATY